LLLLSNSFLKKRQGRGINASYPVWLPERIPAVKAGYPVGVILQIQGICFKRLSRVLSDYGY